jgi:hypothetical protein
MNKLRVIIFFALSFVGISQQTRCMDLKDFLNALPKKAPVVPAEERMMHLERVIPSETGPTVLRFSVPTTFIQGMSSALFAKCRFNDVVFPAEPGDILGRTEFVADFRQNLAYFGSTIASQEDLLVFLYKYALNARASARCVVEREKLSEHSLAFLGVYDNADSEENIALLHRALAALKRTNPDVNAQPDANAQDQAHE